MAKTRKEIAEQLGISRITLWRALQDATFPLPSGKLSTQDELNILRHLGAIPPEPPSEEEE